MARFGYADCVPECPVLGADQTCCELRSVVEFGSGLFCSAEFSIYSAGISAY
jgi:hypothetical protein